MMIKSWKLLYFYGNIKNIKYKSYEMLQQANICITKLLENSFNVYLGKILENSKLPKM